MNEKLKDSFLFGFFSPHTFRRMSFCANVTVDHRRDTALLITEQIKWHDEGLKSLWSAAEGFVCKTRV